MTTLEQSLALTHESEGVCRARSSAAYVAQPSSMFGGWTAALLLRAVMADPRASGAPVALHVNYISRVPPDTELRITTTPLGGSRSVMTWRAELTPTGEGVVTTATVIVGARRETDGFVDAAIKMPEAPPPDTFPVNHPPAAFGQTVDFRPIYGFPPFNNRDTRSVQWIRETTGRAVDHVQLAFLSDAYPPRILYAGAEPRMSPTMALSVYFYATEAELAATGDAFIISEAVGTRAAQSVVGSQLRLWSPHGALLATSEQICWFR